MNLWKAKVNLISVKYSCILEVVEYCQGDLKSHLLIQKFVSVCLSLTGDSVIQEGSIYYWPCSRGYKIDNVPLFGP